MKIQSDSKVEFENDGLPEGWIIVKLEQLSNKIQYGYTAKSSLQEIGPKYLRITDIQNDFVKWEKVPYCKIPKEKLNQFILKPNDLVFARTGATVGKSFLLQNPPKSVFASYLIRIVLCNTIDVNFINYFFKSNTYWNQINLGNVGIAQPNFNATKLSQIEIPIPPLKEQHRIVTKIESIFAQIDACKSKLDQIASTSLAQLKSSILKQAFEGKLVSQNPNDEPAEKLLKRLNPNVEFETKGLPVGWLNFKFNDFLILNYGKSQTKANRRSGNIPIYGSSGITGYHDESLISVPCIIIGRKGSAGIVSYVNEPCWPLDTTYYMDKFPTHEIKFLFRLLQHMKLNNLDTSTAIPSLRRDDVYSLQLIMPPLPEQHRIVTKLESIFGMIDVIDDKVKQSLTMLDSLKQSTLKLAFEGKLVPQDPNDESAEKLLKRLNQDKSKRKNV